MLAAINGQIVSDNLRAGITRACFYEPLVNRTYADMASHYGTAVIPARPYKPRRAPGKDETEQPSVVTSRRRAVPPAKHSSGWASSMITITGAGDHDQPDWLITMTGIRKDPEQMEEMM